MTKPQGGDEYVTDTQLGRLLSERDKRIDRMEQSLLRAIDAGFHSSHERMDGLCDRMDQANHRTEKAEAAINMIATRGCALMETHLGTIRTIKASEQVTATLATTAKEGVISVAFALTKKQVVVAVVGLVVLIAIVLERVEALALVASIFGYGSHK